MASGHGKRKAKPEKPLCAHCLLHVAAFGALCAWCWDAHVYRLTRLHSGPAQEIMAQEEKREAVQLALF